MIQKIAILLFVTLTHIMSGQNQKNAHNYPIPEKNDAHLFYIQRITNSNTVIYEANFDEKGMLDKKKPIIIYWRMYENDAEIEGLRFMERELVFGLNLEELSNSEYAYRVQLKATSEQYIYIKQTEPYKCQAYVKLDSGDTLLERIFVNCEKESYFPKVEYIDVYGEVDSSKVTLLTRIHHH